MRISSILFITLAASTETVSAQLVISAIVNAGSGLVNASPGCMESIYGSNLAPSISDAPAGNLPTTLNGVTVMIGGMPAPLKYVSPGQINFQVPFEVTAGSAAVVVNNGSTSAPFTVQLQSLSPGLISIDPTHSLIIGSDFQLRNTVHGGDTIILYAVGLGPTGPPTATGAAGNSQEPLNRVLFTPVVMIGGRSAQISFAGMAPLFPGVYQINATVPPMPLDNSLVLQSGGVSSSNVVSFAGNNVSNVTGSANLLYPTSTSMVTFSPLSVVGSYTASFDIAPNAQPFTVFAQASSGTSTITVNPQAGTVVGTSTVPTAAERAGDFSLSGLIAIDFLNSGARLPGNILPASRLDPALLMALQNVPQATTGSTGALGTYDFTGNLTPGSHFTTDSISFPTSFAGFTSYTAIPSTHTVSASVALYVDGVPVDSRSVTAKTP